MTDGRFKQTAFDADETDALQAIGWQPNAGGFDCPDSALLLAAEEGVLHDAALGARIRAHAASCPSCRMLVTDLAEALSEDPSEDERARIDTRVKANRPARARGRALWWVGAVGAAATAAVLWMVMAPAPSTPPLAPVTQVARQTPPPIPSVFVVGRPAMPPVDVDLTVRGEGTPGVNLPTQIAAALDKADAGDTAGASSELERIVRRNPNSRSAALALGAVQLRAKEDAAAVATLDRARSLETEPQLAGETDWFLSMALVRTGNRERARALLESLCKQAGARSATACAGVAEIDRDKIAR